VLVAGGAGVASAELYDPATGVWIPTGTMTTARYRYTATLLPNGQVLAVGGEDATYVPVATAELYNPESGNWTLTGSLSTPRTDHRATLLSNGLILICGGSNDSGALASAELYDPAIGTWTATNDMITARGSHTATLLTNGRVLVAGGEGTDNWAEAELYDAGLEYSEAWQPAITSATSPLRLGSRLRLAGAAFRGISQTSGGNTQDSSSNYPVVQLRSLDNSQVVFLPVDPLSGWSDTRFTSLPVTDFPSGPALVTVFTNGIPSTAKYLGVSETP
jgi:hypothetical protein